MTWIRLNYDRVAALATGLFFVCSASLVGPSVWQFGKKFPESPSSPPKAVVTSQRIVGLEQAAERIRQPAQWTFSGQSGLFVPERHFIGGDGFPATLRTTQVHPPVPNEWLEE